MKIAKVIEGSIVRVLNNVPVNLEDTSNFQGLTQEEMATLGWFPVVENYPALGLYEQYGEPTVTVEATQVVHDYPVIPAVLADVQKARKKEFKATLSERVYALRDLDEFMVLLLTDTLSNSLKTKIADLSTAYETAVTALNAATTVADALAVTPVWPAP